MTAPILEMHHGIAVVRDDLFPGGTKARFIAQVFDGVQEAVYASPPEGGAQTAIATVARRLGKRATIFVAARTRPHPRTLEAARLGAKVVPISPGYLSVVQSRAREYCRNTGASLIRKPAATSSRSAATSPRARLPGQPSTSTPASSATARRWARPSRQILTMTRRLGSCASPSAGRAGCCSGTWRRSPIRSNQELARG
jgi:hypothetical protein